MADADGWQGPRRNDEEGFGRLLNKLSSQDERLAAVERGAPLRAAGITADENGLIVDSALRVYGEVASYSSLDHENYVRLNNGVLWFRYSSGESAGYIYATEAGSGRTVLRVRPPRDESIESDGTGLYLEGPTPAMPSGLSVLQSTGWVQLKAADLVLAEGAGGYILRTGTDTSTSPHALYTAGVDQVYRAPTRHYFSGDLHTTGNLSCGGTKPFIIDHPTKADKSLVHVATESDRAVVEYHYRATIGADGSTTLDLPDYFEALTAPDSRGVQVTPVGRPFPVGAEEPTGGQVVVYGDPDRDVFVRVNARRGDDAGQFEVEIPRIQPPSDTEEPS